MSGLNFRAFAGALALAGALTALPAQAAPTGEQLFNDNCSACHQKTGLGVKGAFPALKGDKTATGDTRAVTFLVLNGRGGMPAFKDSLSDAQLAAILTYVRSAWGNKAKPIATADFTKSRTGPPPPARLQAH